MAQNINSKKYQLYKDYQKNIKIFFEFLKNSQNQNEVYLKSIPVINNKEYCLIPISNIHSHDIEIINKLKNWRNKYSHTFLPSKKTNFKNTKKWLLKNVLKKKDKILFLLVKNRGTLIGHIGFANCLNKDFTFEIDNVLKGEKDQNKKIFSLALKSLIKWANNTFCIDNITLKVLKNNTRAIKFYEKNNFNKFVDNKNKDLRNFVSMKYIDNKKVNKMILTAGPSISQKEIFYVNDAVTNGWNHNATNYISKLEQKFANFVGSKYAISTSSCSGAMQIALMSLNLKKNDEVIVPNITWVATAKAVIYAGAKPVFADINEDDWTINPESIIKLINKNTKAIMPVHLYGQPSKMDLIMRIAKKNNLFVIEDAAPAIGAEFKGKKCGTFGDFGAFSFQGAKLLVSGEGGMLVTNNTQLYKKALKIADYGRNKKRKFVIDGPGVKFKMSNIQAALALGQLERINELVSLKRRIFYWYFNELKNIQNIKLNFETKNTKSIYWMTSILLNKKINLTRDSFCKKLYNLKIDTRPIFPELSSFKIWKLKQKNLKNRKSKLISERSINLPSGVCISKKEVVYICNQIKEILKNK